MTEVPLPPADQIRPAEKPTHAEEIVRKIVEKVDAGLTRSEVGPRIPGSRTQACDFSTAVVTFAFQQEAGEKRQTPSPVVIDTYQIRELHAALAHNDTSFNPSSPFTHGINIVTIGNEKFLVDLTFCQFMRNNNGLIHKGTRETDIPSSNLLAQRLLRFGYVRLTDEVLKEFLRITTTARVKYLEAVTVDTLDALPEAMHTRSEANSFDDQELKIF